MKLYQGIQRLKIFLFTVVGIFILLNKVGWINFLPKTKYSNWLLIAVAIYIFYSILKLSLIIRKSSMAYFLVMVGAAVVISASFMIIIPAVMIAELGSTETVIGLVVLLFIIIIYNLLVVTLFKNHKMEF